MKSLVSLSRTLLAEAGEQCGVDTRMDLSVLDRRVEREGDSFATITLPNYCQSLERAIDRGHVALSDFPGWRKSNSGLPRFLGGFLSLIFDPSGVLREDADPDVVFLTRQFLLLRKKVWAVANESRQRAALRSYVSCEESIDANFRSDSFRLVCTEVVLSLLASHREGFDPFSIRGQHGPGATAEGLTTNGRWTPTTWSSRLEACFPVGFHAYSSEEIYHRDAGSIKFLSEDDELPVKVVFVPKTMKTPRVIAIEPSWNQYIQQGLMRWLVPRIEASRLTGGRINFSDQSINQRLALSSSVDGRLATIDMKEASDRVSVAHVEHLFSVAPDILEAILSCRSLRAKLPDGTVVPLKKFASMGSALCFPIEALCFFCGVIWSRLQSRNCRITSASVRKYAEDVYVFGDDIIVPADETPAIIDGLESLGFLVNRSKSFWTGKFRESCGVDAFKGQDITPAYCRFDLDPTDPSSIVSWVALGNQLYQRGLWKTTRFVRDAVEHAVGEKLSTSRDTRGKPVSVPGRLPRCALPHVSRDSAALGWQNFSNSVTHRRWNKRLHRFEERCLVPTPVRRSDPLDGVGALHKSLRLCGSDAVDPKHLVESVRPWSLKLKARWVPAI